MENCTSGMVKVSSFGFKASRACVPCNRGKLLHLTIVEYGICAAVAKNSSVISTRVVAVEVVVCAVPFAELGTKEVPPRDTLASLSAKSDMYLLGDGYE
jgi:hypothetical protein